MEITAQRRRNKNSAARVRDFDENPGSKPTPREEYLLEAQRIQHEIGTLEEIRAKLGLSQRKVCQLLLVDPSAWTRWLKYGAPPHIYQALKWLLKLSKLDPEAAAPSNLLSRVDYIQQSTQSKFEEIESNLALLERSVSLATTVRPATASAEIVELKAEILTLKAALEQMAQVKARESNRIRRPAKARKAAQKSARPRKVVARTRKKAAKKTSKKSAKKVVTKAAKKFARQRAARAKAISRRAR